MPFIGNQPAESYSAFQKQDFSTSATTSYTLDHPVSNQNEIALFINFVRQEPTTAYTASGTSLTLTSATSSSDDMYCVYLGKAVQTVNPPSGSVGSSQVAASIITGQTALGATPADTDELLISDAGTLKRVDYSYLKSANTPSFFVRKTSDQEINDSSTTQVTFDTEDWDTDSAFASNTFTVPSGQAGKYVFNINLQGYDNSGSLKRMVGSLYKNDAAIFQVTNDYNASDMYNILTNFTACLDLSAGDTIKVYGLNDTSDATTSFLMGNSTKRETYFSGFKIIGA